MANEAYDALRQMANSRAAAGGFQAFSEALSRGRARADRERALAAREKEALSTRDALTAAMAEMSLSGGSGTGGRTKGSSSAALGGMGFGRGEDVRAAYNEQVAKAQQLAQQEADLVAEQNRREDEALDRRIAMSNEAAAKGAALRAISGTPGVYMPGGPVIRSRSTPGTPSSELVASRALAAERGPALDLDNMPVGPDGFIGGPAPGTSREAMAERLGISGASDDSIRSAIDMLLAERALASEQPPEGEIASISPAYRAQLGLARAQPPEATSVEMSPSYAREVAQRGMGIVTPSPSGLAGALMTGPGEAELVRANLASLNEGSLDLAIKSLMGESEPVRESPSFSRPRPSDIRKDSEADIAAMEGGAPPPPSQGYRAGARPTMLEAAFDQAAKPQVSVPGAAAPASEAATGPVAHSVQKGDTLFELAKANDTTVEAIVKANPGIKDPNLIEVGQSITMPRGGAPRVDETIATVSAGEPAPPPPKGSAAEAISRKDDITLMSDVAIKGRLLALSEEKGGIKGNPLAEASGGSMDPSVIPRIAEVENAIIDAKKGDKRHLSRILGKSINWQDLKKMDLNKLSADYRSWAGGLNIRADEIKADRRLEAEIKQTKAYEGKAAMFEVAFRGIYPDATPEEVEIFNDQALNIYNAGKGDEAIMAYLNLFRGLGKDEMAHELRMSQEATKRAKLNVSNAAGSKSKGLKDYFNYLEQANKNERLAQEAQKNIDSQTLTQQERTSWVNKKSTYDNLAAQFRSDAQKVRASNQGIDYGTRLAMTRNLLRRLEQNRAALDEGGESAWTQYIAGLKSDLATSHGVYPGISEDMESIEIALRRAYLSKPKGAVRAKPKKDAEPYSSFQEKLTPEAAKIAGVETVARHEAKRSAMAPGIEAKKEAMLRKVSKLRVDVAKVVSKSDQSGVPSNKLDDYYLELRKLSSELSGLEEQYKDIAPFGIQPAWATQADDLLKELQGTEAFKGLKRRQKAQERVRAKARF